MTAKDGKPVEANFLQYIGGFAMQTFVHLGRIPNPLTGKTAVDLPNAKYSIDILGILQEKTKGNLTPEESEQLSNMLRDLRLEYVSAAAGAKDSGGTPQAPAGTAEANGDGKE